VPKTSKTLRQRIDEKCARQPNGCLVYRTSRKRRYAYVSVDGEMKPVHRVVWEMEHGPVPEGRNVLHRCDNPPCREISHLFIGTQKDNVDDMRAKGRRVNQVGIKNGRAKLTDIEVRAIFKDRRSSKILAEKHGVSRVVICNIRRGKSWSHVTRLKGS
jgi:hypothetical protein